MKTIQFFLKKCGVIASSVFAFAFIVSSALASPYGIGQPPSGVVVGAAAGLSFPQSHQNTQKISSAIPTDSAINDTYTTSSQTGHSYDALLSLGYQWSQARFWLPAESVGFVYQYVSPTSMNGVINRYSLSNFGLYGYKYDVSSNLMLMQFKLDLLQWHELMPFVSAAAGVALNKASNFAITSVSGTSSVFNPNFGSASTAQFAYGFGTGFDYYLNRRVQMTLGYQYLNAGSVKTGKSSLPLLGNSTLSNTLSSQMVFLQAAYLFN